MIVKFFMARYFKEQDIQLRFIEFMDVGSTNDWNFEQVITKEQLIEKINRVYPVEPAQPRYFGEVAKLYRYVGAMQKLGLLLQYLSHFVLLVRELVSRQTARFFTCLFGTKGTDLRTLLRGNISDASLLKILQHTWRYRTDRYSDERTAESTNQRPKLKCPTLADSERRIPYARAICKANIVFWNW